METIEFIPIYEYAKKYGISKQNVYRWIREHKIPKDKVKVIKKEVSRILIDKNYDYPIRTN